MNQLKMKLLEELMGHLGDSQGSELKSLLDQSRMPKTESEDPKGLKVESIEVMGEKPNFDEQADDAIGDVAERKKTLGETIGYPGFPKDKKSGLMEGAPDEVAMSNDDDMSDEEFEELVRKFS